MDKNLWEQARDRLGMYDCQDGIFPKLRFAQEEQALKDTPAMAAFALLAKLRAAGEGRVKVDGVINNSFVAWLMGATTVNPLMPHYYCPACGRVEYVKTVKTAFDLPPKGCACGKAFLRDGHGIPADGFLHRAKRGLCVSLRVAPSFYPSAVQILKEAFADTYILPVRIALKNGQFIDEYRIDSAFRPPLAEDGFWHINFPEGIENSGEKLSFNIRQSAKLEDQPSGLAEEVATPALAHTLYEARREKYSFITDHIREEPVDFDLVMRVEGFAHSTNAWRENGEILVEADMASIRQIPAYREQILEDVTAAVGPEGNVGLVVMEKARMGKYAADGMPEETEMMLLAHDLPEWYPWYLSRVYYLCPKGQLVAILQAELLRQ